uniref:Transposase n=1 Tax=Ascaris lumbricoides TaxID=6252 RepID=A0A0M3I653_ASCLU
MRRSDSKKDHRNQLDRRGIDSDMKRHLFVMNALLIEITNK